MLTLSLRKTASCNTDASDDFTTDRKRKCSKNDSALVIALKVHIDSLKRQLRDKHFIIESLLANLQRHSHNTSISSGKQILVKKKTPRKISICSVQKNMIQLNQLKKLQNQLKTAKKVFKLIK